jgi:hypothetical protein
MIDFQASNVSADRVFGSEIEPAVDFRQINTVIRISRKSFYAEKEPKVRKVTRKGKCKKSRFRDLDEAIEVLHRIQRYRGYSEEAGKTLTHRNEKRAYNCPECLGAHLTSQPVAGEAEIHVAA